METVYFISIKTGKANEAFFSFAHLHIITLTHFFQKISILLFALLLGLSATAQPVRISLFNEVSMKCLVVSTLKGNYNIIGDSSVRLRLSERDVIYISLINNHLMVRNSQKAVGDFTTLRFEALDKGSVFRLNPVTPAGDTRQYNDNLTISIAYNRISLINIVDPDNYIAGVVEAEAGSNAEPEFYKAQSILARTYLYGHFNRHESEGFQLCDGVHCQAYKGRAYRNPAIAEATKATTKLVVVGPDSTFITAVFHANCGGETESAR